MTEAWQPTSTDPHIVLDECIRHFAPHAVLSCSFGGPGGLVLIHMMQQLGVRIPIVFLDTQFLFPETMALKTLIQDTFDVDVVTVTPQLQPDEQAARYGSKLWERNPDLCCQLRKVEPMQRVLEEMHVHAWISALRQDQGGSRRSVPTVRYQQLPTGKSLARVHPLAHWSKQDVWRYVTTHRIPYNALLDQGYNSIGCTHCTVRSTGPERAGRWSGHGKTECGLHTF